MCPMLLVSAMLMYIVDWQLAGDPLPYYFLITLIGIFLGGPYNIISATSAIDLSQQPELKGQAKALSTVASLLESVGAFGAAIFQLILSLYSDQAFFIFTGLCLATFCALIPLAIQDIRELRKGIVTLEPQTVGIH